MIRHHEPVRFAQGRLRKGSPFQGISTLLKNAVTMLICSAALCVGVPATVLAFEGLYEGSMELADGTPRTIPLALSLILTGETTIDEHGNEVQVIDGSVLIDDEGGPYSLAKVSVDLEHSTIDLRYSRSRQSLIPTFPASFRLIGTLKADGAIDGKVLSGPRGPIGHFRVARSDRQTLAKRVKYTGTWQGEMVMVELGNAVPVTIVVESGLAATVNPPNFEFDYTDGRLAHLVYKGEKFHFNNVVVDYLRRKMILNQVGREGTSTLTLDCDVNFANGEMTGIMNSLYRGKTATFRVYRMR